MATVTHKIRNTVAPSHEAPATVERDSSPTGKQSKQGRPGFTLYADIPRDSNTFFATRDPTKVVKRAWSLGVVLLEKEHDGYFWRAVIVEGLAMVAFLFTTITVVCVALDTNKQLLFAGIFGISIFILVYFTAGISGGNLNPAVTIALVVGKRISLARGVCYVISQCIGAIIGTLFAKIVSGPEKFNAANGGANTLAEGVSIGQAVCGEIICTAILVLAVLVGLSGELWNLMSKTKMHVLLPFVVGGAVAVSHLVLVPVDGTSVNPARSFGPAVVAGQWSYHIAFWVGPVVGGIVAIILWEAFLRPPQIMGRAEAEASDLV